MTTSRAELITTFEQTGPTLIRLTSSLSDAGLDCRATPGDWSIREILAHLVDDEMYVMRTRLERIVKEDQPSLAPHDEKHWHAHRNKMRDALDDLLDDFTVQRAASLGIIKMLRETDWIRQGYQPEYGLFTAQEWFTQWVTHDTIHLRQIQSNLVIYQAQTSI